MVDSADEPPLSNRIYSWAKTSTSLFYPSRNSTPDPSTHSADILPQHAGHITPSPGQPATSSEDSTHRQDTGQQSASTVDPKREGEESSTIDYGEEKAPILSRFSRDVKRIICSSWVNWLLLIVPPAMILGAIEDWGHHHFVSPSVIFALNAVAIIPLASLLAFATESVASRMGDTIGALLNVTFGNAVEIIIFVIALVANEVRIVQAAALGSILANLLLILGMAFVLGGLRFREQVYNPSIGQTSACLLSLSVISLLLPTAFHAAFSNQEFADMTVVKVSRGTSVVLLLVYCLYLFFQLKSHSFIFESTPQHIIDEESHPGVLADMLNSSSSSDDTSSSSDSEDSHTTSNRIKRALRRRRRKSANSRNSRNTPSPTLTRTSLVDTSGAADQYANSSGDEADEEGQQLQSGMGVNFVQSRDFEDLERGGKKGKKGKRARRVKQETEDFDEKHGTTRSKTSRTDTANVYSHTTPTVARAEVNRSTSGSGIVSEKSHRPLHLRGLSKDLSTAIRPAFSSSVFPHHEATGRALVLPQVKKESPRVPVSDLRRTSSMPDIRRQRSPGPLPTLQVSFNNLPTEIRPEDVVSPQHHLSKTSSVILLLVTTGLVALCAEFLVGSINFLVTNSGVSQAFIGLIILPIVGNAAEHVTAITVAYKNKMDLAINIALGSSIQIALFVTPLMVMLGWAIGADMSLYFSLFETMSLFASAFIVNYLMIDGRTNYLEGILLIAAYVIIAIAAFFYPQCDGGAILC